MSEQHTAMATYTLTISADSGYESTTEGRCTAAQYAAAIAALHSRPNTYTDLKAQRDELLELLKDAAVLADFAECWITDPSIEGMHRLKGGGDKFRAAIAKATGGEACPAKA